MAIFAPMVSKKPGITRAASRRSYVSLAGGSGLTQISRRCAPTYTFKQNFKKLLLFLSILG
jgi:hypothetical protein